MSRQMSTSSRTILGIDPGIGRVGYGVVSAVRGELTLVSYGVIETEPRRPVAFRLRRISGAVRDLIASHHPDRIALERLFFAKNASTAMVVGEARGVILLAAEEAGLPVVEFTPPTVKKTLTGYGSADKGQMQRMIKVMFRLKHTPKPDDAADAIAIALCGSSNDPA